MLDFVGIGAQKAGTTWLFEKLGLHPHIKFPGGKEVHFWDSNYSRGLDWYRSLFGNEAGSGVKMGEITPAYAILSQELIRDCQASFPDLRLIYLLRNPIERAWSSAKMALARSEMQIQEASDQWFLDHFYSQESLMRGDYETCLRNWLSFYRPDQILLCLFDDLEANPEKLLRCCFQHLHVDESKYDWTSDLKNKVFPSEYNNKMPANLRFELRRLYAPKISSLASLLGMDLSCWD